jgi:hypothetical protein
MNQIKKKKLIDDLYKKNACQKKNMRLNSKPTHSY